MRLKFWVQARSSMEDLDVMPKLFYHAEQESLSKPNPRLKFWGRVMLVFFTCILVNSLFLAFQFAKKFGDSDWRGF